MINLKRKQGMEKRGTSNQTNTKAILKGDINSTISIIFKTINGPTTLKFNDRDRMSKSKILLYAIHKNHNLM